MIQGCLDRLQAGDESARQELLRSACGRLERLTRKMLGSWRRVHRWEETGDVMQNSLVRLYRSLYEAKPARVVDFFRLAALHIRRELHDLAKHYYGPRGIGTNHATAAWKSPYDNESADSMAWQPHGTEEDPANLAAWTEFHDQVERLPEEEREVVRSALVPGVVASGSRRTAGRFRTDRETTLGFGAAAASQDTGGDSARFRGASRRRRCREVIAVMSHESRLLDLVVEWEERRAAGEVVAARGTLPRLP